MLTACALGDRFAFVTFSPNLTPWYTEQVIRTGLGNRFAGVYSPAASFENIARVAEDLRDPLLELCRSAARDADVLILAGAPIAGLASEIREEVPALLLAPIQAAVLQAVTLWRICPKSSDRGRFARPPAKHSIGLSQSLENWIQNGPKSGSGKNP